MEYLRRYARVTKCSVEKSISAVEQRSPHVRRSNMKQIIQEDLKNRWEILDPQLVSVIIDHLNRGVFVLVLATQSVTIEMKRDIL